MDVIAHAQAPAHRDMERANSTQHDHVSRETRRRLCPPTTSACLSHVRWHTPFSHLLSHRVPLRERVARQKRGSASCLPSVAMRRAARLLRGDAGESGVRRRTTRISSHHQHGAMPPARSMQGHMGFTLPPTTHYRYCIPLFHVKPAVGCSLTQLCTYVRQLHDGRGARCRTETVATYRDASRLNLTPNGSHKGKSSPE